MTHIFFGHAFMSFLAAISNYFFQVLIARFMGQNGFTTFIASWSHINFFMGLGTWSYYCSAIYNFSEKKFYQLFLFSHFSAVLLFVGFVFFKQEVVLYGIVLTSCIAHSLLTGRLIGKSEYIRAGLINLSVAVFKIILLSLFAKFYKLNSVSVFIILYSSFLFTHIIFFSFNRFKDTKFCNDASVPSTLWAAFLLTVATHFFPVSDVLWVELFNEKELMTDIASLSLVTKAVFFAQLVWAQWWLPKIKENEVVNLFLSKFVIFLSFTLGPLALSICVKSILDLSLGWERLPTLGLFYLSTLSAAFMAIHFQRLQFILIKGFTKRGLVMLLVLIFGWFSIGFISSIDLKLYFAICTVLHGLSIALSFISFPLKIGKFNNF